MKIGNLNRRISILKYEVTRDEYGGEQREWVVQRTLWARIEPVSGTEYFKAEQVEAQNITTITFFCFALYPITYYLLTIKY